MHENVMKKVICNENYNNCNEKSNLKNFIYLKILTLLKIKI